MRSTDSRSYQTHFKAKTILTVFCFSKTSHLQLYLIFQHFSTFIFAYIYLFFDICIIKQNRRVFSAVFICVAALCNWVAYIKIFLTITILKIPGKNIKENKKCAATVRSCT